MTQKADSKENQMVEKRLYEPVLGENVILELQQFTGVMLHRVRLNMINKKNVSIGATKGTQVFWYGPGVGGTQGIRGHRAPGGDFQKTGVLLVLIVLGKQGRASNQNTGSLPSWPQIS